MIRAGRTAVDAEGVAAILNITIGALHNNRAYDRAGFPDRINTHGATRMRLWDEQQVKAYSRDESIPPLPDVDNPGDLLDDTEAAAYVGLALASWKSAILAGRLFDGEQPRDVRGVRHWRRSDLDAIRARRRPAGRPKGSPDTAARHRPTKAEMKARAEASQQGQR